MKKLLLLASFATLLQTTSCINTEREMGTAKSPQVFTPTPEAQRSRLNSRSVLNAVRTTHYFSNTKAKDNFVLLLQGPKIATAQARFLILSSKGDTLRNEVIPATALMSDSDLGDAPATTVRDKELAILKAMNSFFKEDRFVQPAVARSAAQPAEIDPQAWASVKEDSKAVGFDYISNNGRERRIAYAKKLQKAVVIAE
ncbi:MULTISPECIES: hypothetical protein [Hymenobacter]|uniref:Uncharacterized protein n=1 Tax=Hymenobacter jejuensis TaxID=2502781 RepID=A0A5B8A489_9BACT|nr:MULTISPECIES: hypothetical protein [Hymenobacter]MBC6990103.1 hypothetical protein [Hymenobacter sp. BT491]QDA62131.1 hypothetical protein FHG12_19395 [Hymenobacter jejuensis]